MEVPNKLVPVFDAGSVEVPKRPVPVFDAGWEDEVPNIPDVGAPAKDVAGNPDAEVVPGVVDDGVLLPKRPPPLEAPPKSDVCVVETPGVAAELLPKTLVPVEAGAPKSPPGVDPKTEPEVFPNILGFLSVFVPDEPNIFF